MLAHLKRFDLKYTEADLRHVLKRTNDTKTNQQNGIYWVGGRIWRFGEKSTFSETSWWKSSSTQPMGRLMSALLLSPLSSNFTMYSLRSASDVWEQWFIILSICNRSDLKKKLKKSESQTTKWSLTGWLCLNISQFWSNLLLRVQYFCPGIKVDQSRKKTKTTDVGKTEFVRSGVRGSELLLPP